MFVTKLLPDDGEAGVEINQAPRREGGAACHKLDKCLALIRQHCTQDIDQALVARAEGEGRRVDEARNRHVCEDH